MRAHYAIISPPCSKEHVTQSKNHSMIKQPQVSFETYGCFIILRQLGKRCFSYLPQARTPI